jgi:hypothetical protein
VVSLTDLFCVTEAFGAPGAKILPQARVQISLHIAGFSLPIRHIPNTDFLWSGIPTVCRIDDDIFWLLITDYFHLSLPTVCG